MDQLVDRLNEMQKLVSLVGRMDIQVQSEEEAKRGEGERYTTAVGRLALARPHKVYVQIQLPVVRTNFAEFASDGARFQVIVYPEKYRVMLLGTNDRNYPPAKSVAGGDERVRMAGPLTNMRPQHFTGALLFDPIVRDKEQIAFLHEIRQVEDDTREGAARGGRVIRSYYVVSTVKYSSDQGWQLGSAYWFDRNRGLTLSRRQIFEDHGRLVEEIGYSDYWRDNPPGLELPSVISILRPHDQYSARIILNPSSIVLNQELPSTTFVLEKPEDWGDSAQVVDLDRKLK